jgi:hypothetical protein
MRFIKGHQARLLTGPKNSRFNGGFSILDNGRALVYGRDGSLCTFARVMMEAHLGRELGPQEIVHHINGDPSDDRLKNLEVLTRAEHVEVHQAELAAGRLRAAEA